MYLRNFWTACKIFFVVILCLFVWEHIARKGELDYRPSVALHTISENAQNFFEKVGVYFAWFGSYLTLIDLKDFAVTIYAIGEPIFGLIISPAYVIYGFVMEAASYANKQWLVYTGSCLLVILSMFTYYKVSVRYPKINLFLVLWNRLTKRKKSE